MIQSILWCSFLSATAYNIASLNKIPPLQMPSKKVIEERLLKIGLKDFKKFTHIYTIADTQAFPLSIFVSATLIACEYKQISQEDTSVMGLVPSFLNILLQDHPAVLKLLTEKAHEAATEECHQ